MLRCRPEPTAGVLQGSVLETEAWADGGGVRVLQAMLGDSASGPLVAMIDLRGQYIPPPEVVEALREIVVDGGSHYHRSDVFRAQLSDDDRFFSIGARELHFGDFYLQPANLWYNDPPGPNGMLQLLVVADRRGSAPITRKNRSATVDVLLGELRAAGVELDDVHADDESATTGIGFTAQPSLPAPGLIASIFEDASWSVLSDGSRVAAAFMDDRVSGPLVLLSHNAAGAVEATTATARSDMLRLVLAGEVHLGEHTMRAHDFRMVEAGVREPSVVHGLQGSTQLVVFADRRGWRGDGRGGEADHRLDEMAVLLGLG